MPPQIAKCDESKEFFAGQERCHIVEIWRSPDDSMSIARARVEPSVTTAWHALDGVTERYIIASGRGRMEVGDLLPADVGPGDTVFIPAGVRQRIANTGAADLIFYCVCTPPFTATCYLDLDLEAQPAMPAVKIHPMRLPPPPWTDGYVLDYHTVSSTPTGDPYFRFDTKRTDLGELLFQLKYRSGGSKVVSDIVDTVAEFLVQWKPPLDCVVPAPPSVKRGAQPVTEIVQQLGKRIGLPLCEDAVHKTKITPQMKNIDDWSERKRVLADAIHAGPGDVKGKSVLLIDDLIESGSTLRRAAEVLLNDCGARAIYTLVLTRTK